MSELVTNKLDTTLVHDVVRAWTDARLLTWTVRCVRRTLGDGFARGTHPSLAASQEVDR